MAGESATLPVRAGLLGRDAVTQHPITRRDSAPAAGSGGRSGRIYPGCRRGDRAARLWVKSRRYGLEDSRRQIKPRRGQPQAIGGQIPGTGCHIIDNRPGSRLVPVPGIPLLHSRVAQNQRCPGCLSRICCGVGRRNVEGDQPSGHILVTP